MASLGSGGPGRQDAYLRGEGQCALLRRLGRRALPTLSWEPLDMLGNMGEEVRRAF